MTSTAIVLPETDTIFHELMQHTRDSSKCAVCGEALGLRTFNICRFPECDSVKAPEVHKGHTACYECASDPLKYCGEGARCRACMYDLGFRRSQVKFAGVALVPPVENTLANALLKGFHDAEVSVQAAVERADFARIREGTDRRVAAVEDVRRRHALEEEARATAERQENERLKRETARMESEARQRMADAERKAQEKVAEAEREAQEKAAAAERDAQEKAAAAEREAQEKVATAEREAHEKAVEAEREVQEKVAEAEREAREHEDRAAAAAQRAREMEERVAQQEEAERQRVAQREADNEEAVAAPVVRRRRRATTSAAQLRINEQRKRSRAERDRKVREHEELSERVEEMEAKAEALTERAHQVIERACDALRAVGRGAEADVFYEEAHALLLQDDADPTSEEDGDVVD